MNKIIIFVLFILFILPLANAQQQTLGTFLQNTCIQLKQTCGNCTFVNLTRVSAPDSIIALSGNFLMTKSDTTYNYTFCNTSKIGEYIIDWKGDSDGKITAGNYNFFVSLTGMKPTTAQGTIYLFLGFLSIIFFGLSLFGAILIPWDHKRNDKGIIVGLNDLKYVKLFLWFLSYLMLIFIVFAFRHVSRIADWDVGSNWFNGMFWFLIVFLFPIFVIVFVSGIISFLDAQKIDKLITRGFKPR